MPLALEDCSKGTSTYSLLNGDFSRVNLPVVTWVSVSTSVLKQHMNWKELWLVEMNLPPWMDSSCFFSHWEPWKSGWILLTCQWGQKQTHTTFFLSSDEEGLRSLCSEGDLGGLRPGDPREDDGLVESFGEGSGPASMIYKDKKELPMENIMQYFNVYSYSECSVKKIRIKKQILPTVLLNFITS